jgi:hypothetical protein
MHMTDQARQEACLLNLRRNGAVLSAIQMIVGCLKGALKTDKPPTEVQLLAKYDKLCIVIDEVIHEVCMLRFSLVSCVSND